MCVRACVRLCVRVCVRTCVRACMRACCFCCSFVVVVVLVVAVISLLVNVWAGSGVWGREGTDLTHVQSTNESLYMSIVYTRIALYVHSIHTKLYTCS